MKQETLEEAAENYTKDGTKHFMEKTNVELGFIAGYKLAQERSYSEEDMRKAIEYGYQLRNNNKPINSGIDWVKEFNSLNKQD
jgi:hypothetical protein